MSEYRYEVTLERIEVFRGRPDDEDLERSWNVGVLDNGRDPFIKAFGILRMVTPAGTAQAMASALIVPSVGGDLTLTELGFSERVGVMQRIGCDEMLYDTTRRCIVSQSAHMDLGFDFELKAPAYEAGRVSLQGNDDKATSPYKVGDRIPSDQLGNADCPSTHNKMGFTAFCMLDGGHGGQHVAVDNELTVVEVWD